MIRLSIEQNKNKGRKKISAVKVQFKIYSCVLYKMKGNDTNIKPMTENKLISKNKRIELSKLGSIIN